MKEGQERLRLILLGIAVTLIFIVFALRLAQIQIVEGDYYLALRNSGSTRTQVIRAARGEIVDRSGNPLAYNEACYNIVFDKALSPETGLNENIFRLITILRGSGEEWVDALPLEKQPPFAFTDNDAEISRIKSKSYLDLNNYATSEEVLYWLRMRYGLEGLSETDARAVAGVRYEMEKKGYSISTRYTFAEDISLETAVRVRQSLGLPGVEVEETARRTYIDGALAPHIVGRVGAIFPDELEDFLARDRGYTREDTVGKEGVEKAFEDTLRGTNGLRRVELDASFKVTGIFEEVSPVPGDTVVLTLDRDIQMMADRALREEIALLNATAPAGEGREADAGAVVVIDIKRSEVLAAVTYPSYDLSTYLEDYAENAANPLYPLLNRALSGIYAPGSCFKPVTSTAGLAEGIITPLTRVNCGHVYTFYTGYQPTCLGYHGAFTVVDALRHSCNIFFYDTGRQVGVEKLNEYARALGLGSPTGIELYEAAGRQTNPDTQNPGDALQTAIGQLDNAYTPLQIANYAATLARNGERRRLKLVKSVSSAYDWRETLDEQPAEVVERLDLPQEVFETIRTGMVQATHDPRGTAYRYLGDYPVRIASKTGTPQTADFPNSVFICYAPADDPQIAVAVVIEKGWHGYTGAPVARAVFDAYFFGETVPPEEAEAPTAPENDLPQV